MLPQITHYRDGTCTVHTLDRRAWVADLKATVPLDFREWDPGSKVRTVWPAFDEVVVALTRQHFGAVDESGMARGWESAGNDSDRVPHLRETALGALTEAAYLILTRRRRRGRGNSETTPRIDGAYAPLKALASS